MREGVAERVFFSFRARSVRGTKEYSISETSKITKTKGVAFDDFDLVIEAFGKGISIWAVKRVYDRFKPSLICSSTTNKRLNITV